MNDNGCRIGFAGVGKMGLPICLRLREAGLSVTILSSPGANGVLPTELADAGCEMVLTGTELAGVIDVLITCLPSSADVETVLTGKTGVFSGLPGRTDILHIDHTSGLPDTSKRLASAWDALGGGFIDAAIMGTPELARNGDLKLLCGGSAETVERMRRITDVYANTVVNAGEIGSGHMLRLIGGLMGYGMAMLSSEAFLLCAAAGIAPQKLMTMISGTGADSRTFQAMVTTEIDTDDTTARRQLSIRTVAKDLDALLLQATQLDCDITVVATIAERMRKAAAHSRPEAVISELTHALKALPASVAQG